MAFSREASIVAQTCAKVAGDLLRKADGTVNPDEFIALQDAIFNNTIQLAGAETVIEILEAIPNSAPRGGGGGGSYNRGGGGGQRATSDPNVPAADFIVQLPKHKGKTLAAVYAEDSQYVEWLASASNDPVLKAKAAEYMATV